ncbi:unnamed protein product, partial [Linum tenue]
SLFPLPSLLFVVLSQDLFFLPQPILRSNRSLLTSLSSSFFLEEYSGLQLSRIWTSPAAERPLYRRDGFDSQSRGETFHENWWSRGDAELFRWFDTRNLG